MPVLLLTAVPTSFAAAQEAGSASADDWDVTQPRGELRTIDFTTREGTWMSVDVSPDGRWIVFDLLEHIYRIPTGGGQAESLTQNSGLAVNFHPRYSPDGEQIAFISDRGGQQNLWIMDSDGSSPRAVFEEDYVQASQPAWTPDGKYIVVRRETVRPDGGDDGEGLWMYHRDGGNGVELVGDDGDGSPAWPTISDDGRYLYYYVVAGSGGEPLGGDLQLRRYDFESGEIVQLTAGNAQGPALARQSSGDRKSVV